MLNKRSESPVGTNANERPDTVTVRKLAWWENSTSGRYCDVALPRLRFLEGAAA